MAPMLRQPLDLKRPRAAIDEVCIPCEWLIEPLKIARQTGVAWVAPAKHDARLREQQGCHAQRENVVRHLVDYPLCPAADLPQMRNVLVRQPAGQGRVLVAASVDISLYIADVLQFAGSRRARMAGGDLLDQAGAGTRQADDKYRHLRRVPVLLRCRIKLRDAGFDQPVDMPPEHRSVVSCPARPQELTVKGI